MILIKVKSSTRAYNLEAYSSFIKKEEILVKKVLFSEMCEKGCKNYGNKFSCPPRTPCFDNLFSSREKEGLLIVMFLMRTKEINSTEYNKIRIANSIMKSRIDKLMRILENKFETKFLSSGSCRLCRTCCLKLKKPCKHPEKMRYSLEATGIDCNSLSENLFNIPLLWFKQGKAPEYTCVLAGLFCDAQDAEEIKSQVESLLNKLA